MSLRGKSASGIVVFVGLALARPVLGTVVRGDMVKKLGAWLILVVGLSLNCAASPPPHAAMPTPLVGLDVVVGPGVALSGEGVRRFPAFGNALTDAIASRLQTDGFEIVAAARSENAFRIALGATLAVSRSQLIIINGRPLESDTAQVAVKVLAPDGGLVDAFEVSGDPGDAETPSKVAASVAERMKGSARLVALAEAGPRAAAPRASIPAPAPSPPRASTVDSGSDQGGRPPQTAREPDGSRVHEGPAGPTPAWVGELPTVSAVKAAVTGKTPHDTAIRIGASFDVLQHFIDILSGNRSPPPDLHYHGCPWPEGWKLYNEYSLAKHFVIRDMAAREPVVPGRNTEFYGNVESAALARTKKFAAEVLPKFFSRQSRDAYFAHAEQWYQEEDAIDQEVAVARGAKFDDCATYQRHKTLRSSDAEQLRVKCEAQTRAAAERSEVTKFVAGDLAKARSAGVNLSVFGVPLGEPFPIPDCPKIDMFTMTTAQVVEAQAAEAKMDACRVDATEGPWNFASAMILDPEGAGYSEVTLAASKRPPWVTSTGMLIKGGVVMAVTIATTDENEKEQIAALRAKYGKPRPQSVEGMLEWRLPGLYVQFQDRSSIPQATQYVGGNVLGNAAANYGSVMGRAKKPNLFIMLESVHKNQAERKAAKKAAEPRL
jgi:hypothetical protein